MVSLLYLLPLIKTIVVVQSNLQEKIHIFAELPSRSRSRPKPAFLAGAGAGAGAGAEKIMQFRLRLHYKGRRRGESSFPGGEGSHIYHILFHIRH